MLTFFWRCESTELDETHDLASDAGDASLNFSATLSETAALVGESGLWANGAAQHASFDSTHTIFDPGEGAIGFLLYVTAWAGGTAICIFGADNTNQYGVRLLGLNESGNIAFFVGDPDSPTAEAVTTIGSLGAGVLYGVVGRWNHAEDTLRIEVYSDPLGTPTLIQGVSNTNGYTAPSSLVGESRFRIGDQSGTGFTAYYDNIFASQDFDEPIEDNFGITSYTEYGVASIPAITSLSDTTLSHGQAGVIITGTGFGSNQGSGRVIVSPTNDIEDGAAVDQEVTAWSGTSITFTADLDAFDFGATLYVFVQNDAGDSNAEGEPISRVIGSVTLNFTGADKFVNKDGQPQTNIEDLTFYVWRSPRPTGAPDQVFTDQSLNSNGEISLSLDVGELEDGDTVFFLCFTPDGTDLYSAGEKLPEYV